jgi:pilus assembly protein TadC
MTTAIVIMTKLFFAGYKFLIIRYLCAFLWIKKRAKISLFINDGIVFIKNVFFITIIVTKIFYKIAVILQS